jgi:hypothetical protein
MSSKPRASAASRSMAIAGGVRTPFYPAPHGATRYSQHGGGISLREPGLGEQHNEQGTGVALRSRSGGNRRSSIPMVKNLLVFL